MTYEEIAQHVWKAAEAKNICRIQLEGEPLSRTIHPYGICKTTANRIVLVCWQSLGFTKPGGKEGYRNLQLNKILEVEILSTHFSKREDFCATDSQYKEWVFHI